MSTAHDEFNEFMRDKSNRGGHPEDEENDSRSSSSDSRDDSDGAPHDTNSHVEPNFAESIRLGADRSTIPTRRYGANTGPKGVISDAQAFRDARQNQRMSARNAYRDALTELSLAPQEQVLARKYEEEDDEELESDDNDDDFMKKWRQSRMEELKNVVLDSRTPNGHNTTICGKLTAVDGEGYLEAVDESPPDSVVIVYIFDDSSQVSNLLEGCMRALANKYQSAVFVKLHYEEAQMEPAGVPAIIAYRGGEKFAGLVPIINELPNDADLSSATLEIVLKRHQILT